ncbi:DNA cytosine methyltransferase [Streptococcus equi]|uniref:DNA cytosine methyltransferase n=1 Tax=Streptococcus equi TaxID=1336 RepID=UPI000658783A|nr:DNA cytosine methyltransferase [Streptococcus equi]MCD3471523.1 DNA cytosine methyltransferase [Streptococcus equi subsp. equi]CRR01819.1 DNA methylase [Streptococcus equi subsp. equi]CRR21950.1 DNA methylase [Streptococcus equi subsp. equi]CRR22498.1 DNA methylase [Streptococcus equi subsp. equi]CRR22563.1 DNA methylase [Streptococcus equi subsp. equi]
MQASEINNRLEVLSLSLLNKNATKKGYLVADDGDGIDTAYPDSKTRKGRVQKNMSHTITTDDSKAFLIGASRGRDPENPNDRSAGNQNLQQRLEINKNGTSNTITSVQKDNYAVEFPDYRIRKLTPLECWRLMGCSDEDFEKAQSVNSNSQLYKQAGNAIVVDVLEAILKQLFLTEAQNEH